MKNCFLAMALLFTMIVHFSTASAQDSDPPRPPITPQNAEQIVELAQADLSLGGNFFGHINPAEIAIGNTQLATAFNNQIVVYRLPDLILDYELGAGCRVGFSPDEAFLLYGGCDSNLTVWNLETQRIHMEIGEQVEKWHFSPDGERMIVYEEDQIHIFDAESWGRIGDLPNVYESGRVVAMAPHGDWIAWIDHQAQIIYWWDIDAETPVETEFNGQIIEAALPRYSLYSNEPYLLSNQLLIAQIHDVIDDEHLRVYRLWDATTHAEIATLIAPEGYYWACPHGALPLIRSFDDGKKFAIAAVSSTDSYIIQVWDIDDLSEPAMTLTDPDALGIINSLETDPNSNLLLVDSEETYTNLTFWDINTQTQLSTLGGAYTITHRVFSPDNTFLAFSLEKNEDSRNFHHATGLWDIATGTLSQMVWHNAPVVHTIFAPDTHLMLTLTEDGLGHVWGIGDNEEPTSPITENRAEYEGVSLDLGLFPGSEISGEIIEPVGRWSGEMFWLILPEHIEMRFNQPDGPSCWIEVFSAADYIAMYPGVLEPFAEGLQADPPEYRPHVDLWPNNAVRNVHSQVKYLSLANGDGWRALAHFSQGAWPITGGVLYQALGLINNGEYYVRAQCGTGVWFLPVRDYDAEMFLGLPADDRENPKWGAFYDTYNDYLRVINRQLENSADSGFQPTLDALDALMASIQIVDAPLGGNLPGCNFDSLLGQSPVQVRIVGQNPRFYCDHEFNDLCYREREIPDGILLDLMDGPVCSEDTLWWQVAYPDEKAIGWLPEAVDGDPWLEPVVQTEDQ